MSRLYRNRDTQQESLQKAYRRRTETSKGNVSRRNKRRVRREHRRAYRSRKSRGEARGHIRTHKSGEGYREENKGVNGGGVMVVYEKIIIPSRNVTVLVT